MTKEHRVRMLVEAYLGSPIRKVLGETFLPNLANTIRTHGSLEGLVHSLKFRMKDPEHLYEKLLRKPKLLHGKRKVTEANLFSRVSDLAGLRVLHLHSRQIEKIDQGLRSAFGDMNCKVVEGPFVRTWDDESRVYYRSLGMKVEPSPNMYTSVHYVIAINRHSRCEIQVRTLMEEVWGEVDHAINYPVAVPSVACREQIRALARATSSCSRLVDSIVASHREHIAHSTTKKSGATASK